MRKNDEFSELQKIAEGHAGDRHFTPADRVPKSLVYRDRKGRRIGVPEDPSLSIEDFADMVTADMDTRDVGGNLSGFGNFLVHEGREGDVYGERTKLPEGDVDVAEQDLYPEGTPGRGTEIDGEESFDALRSSAAQLRARRTVAQWERDLNTLEARFKQVVKNAQVCENKGDVTNAGQWDKRAVSLGRTILALRNKIKARKLYERDAAANEPDVYEEQPTGLTGFDDLKSQTNTGE